MYSVVLHAGLILLVAISILAFSEFQFILRIFFYMLFGIVLVGLLNGLVFFPVLLSLIGPAGEVSFHILLHSIMFYLGTHDIIIRLLIWHHQL
jgi:hypothetical protein